MENTSPFHDFGAASAAVLKLLRGRFGFDLWMVTRKEGDHWIVLQSEDHGYGMDAGRVFQWADSFCMRMVNGEGPRIAPRSDDVPAYVAAPIGRQVQIGAYIGVPLTQSDGELFGTLCAIHPTEKPPAIENELPLIELQARLLSTLLAAELKQQEATRRAERAEVEAMLDEMTGLFNRRGWDKLLEAEEDRCARYGHPAAVIVLDIDGLKQTNDTLGHDAGDDLIRRAAIAITAASRTSDIVARLGGDEFGILGVECDSAEADTLTARLREILASQRVQASIGVASRVEAGGLLGAVAKSDQAMYVEKSASRERRLRNNSFRPAI